MPKGFLVKLQVTDMAITGQTGQCKDDKLVISDGYATLGLARSPSFEVKNKKRSICCSHVCLLEMSWILTSVYWE